MTQTAVVRVWAQRYRLPIMGGLFGLILLFAARGPVWPGALVALAGETIQVWSAGYLEKNVRLVTSGPYGYMRNPMYLGRFLVGLGFVLVVQSWAVALAYTLVFAAYAHARVLREEKRLAKSFGSAYLDYCRVAPRWLPRPGGRSGGQEASSCPTRFCWRLVLSNHQHRVALAVVAGLLILALRVELVPRYLP